MTVQKWKKNCWRDVFAFLNGYYFNTHLMKAPNFLGPCRPYERVVENLKTVGFSELFLPENDFET